MIKIKNLTLLATLTAFSLVGLVIPSASAQTKSDFIRANCENSPQRASCFTSESARQFSAFGEENVRNFCFDYVSASGDDSVSTINSRVDDCVDSVRESFEGGVAQDEETRQRLREQGAFEPGEDGCEVNEGEALTRDNCGIINYIVILINFLSALAMMAIVASVMFAGYQYMTARDNPSAVGAAKQRIVWALVALAIFVFGYAILNFLVPGGVL